MRNIPEVGRLRRKNSFRTNSDSGAELVILTVRVKEKNIPAEMGGGHYGDPTPIAEETP
jgi:hypothetical protein